MQILQVIKRQSTVRTLQEIYSYWKGNKCLTWNGYNEKFDSVSQQEILSLKTSTVSILPSSFENCHSDPFCPLPHTFLSVLFLILKTWAHEQSCFLSPPVLLLIEFHPYFHFHFHVVVEKSLGLERTVSLLLLFLDMFLGMSMHIGCSVIGNGVLTLRPPSQTGTTVSPGPPLLYQVTGSLSQQLQSGLKERVQSWCILAGN